MAIYKAQDLKPTPDVKNPDISMVQLGGELMKVGIVTYLDGEGPLPHSHPNDEQYVHVLEGRAVQLLGEEVTIVEPGDIIHIPRNVVHGMRVLESPYRFFSCKSPSGTGQMSEDYTAVANAEDLVKRLAEVS